MSEMVERVARAIAASDEPHEPWENWAERHKETFRASARAAIKAQREPTEAMEKAGASKWDDDLCTETNALNMWQAMNDEALQ